jgi:hypothetical protein
MKHNFEETFTADREITHKHDKLGRKSVSRRDELPSRLRRERKVIPIMAHGFWEM